MLIVSSAAHRRWHTLRPNLLSAIGPIRFTMPGVPIPCSVVSRVTGLPRLLIEAGASAFFFFFSWAFLEGSRPLSHPTAPPMASVCTVQGDLIILDGLN